MFDLFEFQHTAARRRLLYRTLAARRGGCVSTHSRPKAAAAMGLTTILVIASFNTQPPEGGCMLECASIASVMCFNTQPPEGGCRQLVHCAMRLTQFQHTAARRRLRYVCIGLGFIQVFQHTAARRRLQTQASRRSPISRFNTQPPEGGCVRISIKSVSFVKFQHTAARRRLPADAGG